MPADCWLFREAAMAWFGAISGELAALSEAQHQQKTGSMYAEARARASVLPRVL